AEFRKLQEKSAVSDESLRNTIRDCRIPPEIGNRALESQTHGQATHLPSLNSKGGTASAQLGLAIGQRVRNAQPEGLRIGVGMSPVRRMRRFCAASGSGSGTAESRAFEYG